MAPAPRSKAGCLVEPEKAEGEEEEEEQVEALYRGMIAVAANGMPERPVARVRTETDEEQSYSDHHAAAGDLWELQPLNIAVRYVTRVLQSDDYVDRDSLKKLLEEEAERERFAEELLGAASVGSKGQAFEEKEARAEKRRQRQVEEDAREQKEQLKAAEAQKGRANPVCYLDIEARVMAAWVDAVRGAAGYGERKGPVEASGRLEIAARQCVRCARAVVEGVTPLAAAVVSDSSRINHCWVGC
eukprot:Skav202160  [mRNA]  locus=scaffold970:296729:305324:- [translate_table: standard]